jgi:hypothetical protein
MELIAERGLPVAPQNASATEKPLSEAALPVVKAPLTSGFARTGYEQDQIAKSEANHSGGQE